MSPKEEEGKKFSMQELKEIADQASHCLSENRGIGMEVNSLHKEIIERREKFKDLDIQENM